MAQQKAIVEALEEAAAAHKRIPMGPQANTKHQRQPLLLTTLPSSTAVKHCGQTLMSNTAAAATNYCQTLLLLLLLLPQALLQSMLAGCLSGAEWLSEWLSERS